MLNKLSSYQNPEGLLQDRLVPRTEMRNSMFQAEWFERMSVLDLGCNNGFFCRLAKKLGSQRTVGVDISPCIEGAKLLAKKDELDCEFWQLDMESVEFQRFCPKFDTVLLMSSLAKIKDKERFLKWLDTIVKGRLIFESNHGEVHKKDIELIQKYMYFKYVDYLGPSEIPEKPHYLWCLSRIDHTRRYKELYYMNVEFVPIDKIIGWDEKSILEQKTKYKVDSEEFKKLKEDIRQNGVKDPLIVNWRPTGFFEGFQGGHRYLACKELGYKVLPCYVFKNRLFPRLGQHL